MYKQYLWEGFAVFVVLALFVLAGYFSNAYSDFIMDSFGKYGILGMVIYVVGATIATVIAPLSFLPLLPIAVTLWGSLITAILSIFAWTIGAAIAFLLARRFGYPLVKKFVGKKKMEKIAHFIPEKNIFIGVVLMRIVLPVDLLSYALGLFNIMRFRRYIAATIIGITPFAFIFSYLSETRIIFQISVFLLGVLFVISFAPYLSRRYRKVFAKNTVDNQP